MSQPGDNRGPPEWVVATVTLATVRATVGILYTAFLFLMAAAAD